MSTVKRGRATITSAILGAAAVALLASIAWPTTDTVGVVATDGTITAENVSHHLFGYIWMGAMVCAAIAFVVAARAHYRNRINDTYRALLIGAVLSLPSVIAPLLALIAKKMIDKDSRGSA